MEWSGIGEGSGGGGGDLTDLFHATLPFCKEPIAFARADMTFEESSHDEDILKATSDIARRALKKSAYFCDLPHLL